MPFVIVHTPAGVNLYCGFRHRRLPSGEIDGVLGPLTDFNNISDLVDGFHADAIDSGAIWHKRGQDVTPDTRVDWKLLDNLRTLDTLLQRTGLRKETSHALIGKYVYLHYLRDRGILSPKKLGRWGIEPSSVFGRTATLDGVSAVVARLDEWLNGSVFPLDFRGKYAPKQDHLRYVAGVFAGDEVSEAGDQQLSLDFLAYNFSFIPIETLSVVYEQFLHAPDEPDKPSRGRKIGAYYTPIPVVNLMLAELQDRRLLEKGMRVLDPSCGSGAFLVQCYRRLIEKEFPPGSKPKPAELRELLEGSIFGVDLEDDACNVTELSLILTLLDYVHPPDLEGPRSRFQLPALRGKNIFRADFFENPAADNPPLQKGFDWIVGNPPWKRLNPDKLENDDKPVLKWLRANEKTRPVGGNQAARAFAWELLEYLAPDGEVGFFLPAMTLFEDAASGFRQAFFQHVKVHTVVNFSNLAEVLAGRRFRVPAAAFFYRHRDDAGDGLDEDEFVRTFSPFVANQEPTRPVRAGARNESWSILINASEIRDIPTSQVADGSGLPWKLAAWGSSLDQRLLSKLGRRFLTLRDLERHRKVLISEGLQLRRAPASEEDEEVDLVEEAVGKNKLDVGPLARLRHVFAFPADAIVPVEPDLRFARKGRTQLPLSVCRPPNVIVSAARNFAVYHDDFLVVPARQIGIVSPTGDEDFLKALSLYLSSDFAFYHQFLTSTQFGVQRGLATLNALRRMPFSIESTPRNELVRWSELHSELVQTKPRTIGDTSPAERTPERQLRLAGMGDVDKKLGRLLEELNGLVSESLGLDDGERALIHDLVHVRLALNDGKTGPAAVRPPKVVELRTYAERLKSELDDFMDVQSAKRHQVAVIHDGLSGMVQVDLIRDSAAARKVQVMKADNAAARELERTRQRLRVQRSQWVYFDRNLRIYEGTRTFVFKPMQRFHWTESQAMVDARQIIAETLQGGGVEA
ncbi:MAG: SAM-dependent DNA methyltransferase [Candidatus Anammoximicrobium sp.]|nr:SAM-dependent DNA methyltransferase [Candidatus Anammoximicrobium sp.]